MSRRTILLACSLAAALAAPGGARAVTGCAAAAHPGGEWRTFGHDLANSRNQSDEHTISTANVGSLELKFVLPVEGAGAAGTVESAPMIADGCLYIGTQSGWMIAANADTGAIVWQKDLGDALTTPSITNGRVFVNISRPNAPAVAALDQATGALLWQTTISEMRGSDADGSIIAFGDLVATGIGCQGAEGASGANRFTCRGGVAILNQSDGGLRGIAWGIPDAEFVLGTGGGAVWGTPGLDEETGYLYAGAGNPFGHDHPHANAMLKVDVDPSRPTTFATVVDSYKGTPEQYLPILGANKPVCEAAGYQFGACELPDLDMAVAPTIYRNDRGRKVVSVGQGSGVWHTMRADTMEFEWSTLTGLPYLGNRSGGGAFDGEHMLIAGGLGTLYALDKDNGSPAWANPFGAGNNSFNPLAYANGVVYALGGTNRPPFLFGVASPPFLIALDAASGQPLFVHPFILDIVDVGQGSVAGGVVVARNTVYAPVNGVTGGGYIAAYGLPS